MKTIETGGLKRTVYEASDFKVGMNVVITTSQEFGKVVGFEGEVVLVDRGQDLDSRKGGGWYPASLLPKREWLRARMEGYQQKANAYRQLMLLEDKDGA